MKGKTQPLGVYECFDGDEEPLIKKKLKALDTFHRGVNCYHSRDFDDARQLFTQVLAVIPEDRATQLFLEKTAFYQMNGVDKEWTGVEEMTSK